MKIGLDLSVIQTPHRMRGIGATAINFINNLPAQAKQDHEFVIFLYDTEQENALELLNLKGIHYEIRNLPVAGTVRRGLLKKLKPNKTLVNKFTPLKLLKKPMRGLRLVKNMYSEVKSIYRDNYIVKGLEGIDVFLQFDQTGPLPKSHRIKKVRILYDVIPYVMENDYLWSYGTARMHGDSRTSSMRKHIHRRLYKLRVKTAAKQADSLIAISEHTKNDFLKYIGSVSSRLSVVHLGVTHSGKKTTRYPGFKHYAESSWGYIPKDIDLSDKPFLLFIGGADPRRKINDLVAAFNNLRAQGTDLRLVLAGDTMKGARAIPVPETQNYIADSSYLEDIIFLGFVSETQKGWLYQNTVAFVYPSVYEGFGLPILEAMQYGASVITYKNSSITEIVDDAAILAKNYQDIKKNVDMLLQDPSLRSGLAGKGPEHTKNFSWQKTVEKMISILTEDR